MSDTTSDTTSHAPQPASQTTPQQFSRLLMDVFQRQGWEPSAHDSDAFQSVFLQVPHAAGISPAFIRIVHLKDEYRDVMCLQADYQSEGRNCLAAQIDWLPLSLSPQEIESRVQVYSDACMAEVDSTYARRLYLYQRDQGSQQASQSLHRPRG